MKCVLSWYVKELAVTFACQMFESKVGPLHFALSICICIVLSYLWRELMWKISVCNKNCEVNCFAMFNSYEGKPFWYFTFHVLYTVKLSGVYYYIILYSWAYYYINVVYKHDV